MRPFERVSLLKRDREAIEAAVQLLKKKLSPEMVILFGSKARGDYDEHSDIDLLVISPMPLHWKEEKAVVEALFDIGMKYDVLFSPLFISTEEWEAGMFREFPLYQQITRDGAVVT